MIAALTGLSQLLIAESVVTVEIGYDIERLRQDLNIPPSALKALFEKNCYLKKETGWREKRYKFDAESQKWIGELNLKPPNRIETFVSPYRCYAMCYNGNHHIFTLLPRFQNAIVGSSHYRAILTDSRSLAPMFCYFFDQPKKYRFYVGNRWEVILQVFLEYQGLVDSIFDRLSRINGFQSPQEKELFFSRTLQDADAVNSRFISSFCDSIFQTNERTSLRPEFRLWFGGLSEEQQSAFVKDYRSASLWFPTMIEREAFLGKSPDPKSDYPNFDISSEFGRIRATTLENLHVYLSFTSAVTNPSEIQNLQYEETEFSYEPRYELVGKETYDALSLVGITGEVKDYFYTHFKHNKISLHSKEVILDFFEEIRQGFRMNLESKPERDRNLRYFARINSIRTGIIEVRDKHYHRTSHFPVKSIDAVRPFFERH
ncbi:MAG: hypothetical protein AAF558_03040 [Verrucomicrobiota bacterium]